MDFGFESMGEFLPVLLFLIPLLVLVWWRLFVATNGSKNTPHPFQKSFYKKLYAGLYSWRSDRIFGNFRPYKWFDNYKDGGLRRIELLEKSVKIYPTARALADLAQLVYSRKVVSNQCQEEKSKHFQIVTDCVQQALLLEPDNFDLYSLKANHYIWSVNLSSGAEKGLSEEDEAAILKILNKGIAVFESMPVEEQRKHVNRAESIYQFRTIFLLRTGRFQDALNDTDKVLDLSKVPNSSICHYRIAALIFLGRYSDAISEFEKWSSKYHQEWFKIPSEKYTNLKAIQEISEDLQQMLDHEVELSLEATLKIRDITDDHSIQKKVNLLLNEMKLAAKYFSIHSDIPRILEDI